MAQDKTLHIKVEPDVADGLRRMAKKRRTSVGELVREAITCCYQPGLTGLTVSQRQALEAYRGGYISLAKLGETMGMSALDVRDWLNGHGIPQNSSFNLDDVKNA